MNGCTRQNHSLLDVERVERFERLAFLVELFRISGHAFQLLAEKTKDKQTTVASLAVVFPELPKPREEDEEVVWERPGRDRRLQDRVRAPWLCAVSLSALRDDFCKDISTHCQ